MLEDLDRLQVLCVFLSQGGSKVNRCCGFTASTFLIDNRNFSHASPTRYYNRRLVYHAILLITTFYVYAIYLVNSAFSIIICNTRFYAFYYYGIKRAIYSIGIISIIY